jgi:hypothetical protein
MLRQRQTKKTNSHADASSSDSAPPDAAFGGASATEPEIDEASIGIYPPVADACSNREAVAPAPTTNFSAIVNDLAQALQSGDIARLRVAAALLQNHLAKTA